MDAALLINQTFSGLSTAMLSFIAAAGLSLVFGVMRLLNFAHGSMFMAGAYLAWQYSTWLGGGEGAFWLAVLLSALTVGVIAAVIEVLFFKRLYGQPELIQLLFTYALVLITGDVVKFIWGSQQLSLARPPSLADSLSIGSVTLPHYNLFLLLAGLLVAGGLWWLMQRTRVGMVVRASSQDREMMSLLGSRVQLVFLSVFSGSAVLAGLAGALIAPTTAIVPGMDTEIIIPLFIIVVIGGLGSIWGAFLGSVIYGVTLSFGILLAPRFSLFAVASLMVVILIIRPQGLAGEAATR
ncbi:branched-chain amino acid ABC transporter permease [Massilia sp. W12]|uniref:branched-chain amino acid ABC transporter permease n=1 Tax=Massilia sp. W12 TaxID=3126507 RepID=UPI0030D34A13